MLPVLLTIPVLGVDFKEVTINMSLVDHIQPYMHSSQPVSSIIYMQDDSVHITSWGMQKIADEFHNVVATLGAYFMSSMVFGEVPTDLVLDERSEGATGKG